MKGTGHSNQPWLQLANVARKTLVAAAFLVIGPCATGASLGNQTTKGVLQTAAGDDIGRARWLQNSQVLYIAVQGRGVFRLPLSTNNLELLGLVKCPAFDDFRLSPSGRYLIYQLQCAAGETPYIYDLDRTLEQKIIGLGEHADIAMSPNDQWMASACNTRDDQAVCIMNVPGGRVKRLTLPAAYKDWWLFEPAWTTESSLVLGAEKDHRQIYWHLPPDTRLFTEVHAAETKNRGTSIFDVPNEFFKGSKEIKTVCKRCSTMHSLSTAPVEGGAVSIIDGKLVLHKTGGSDRIIAAVPSRPTLSPGQVPCACGPEGIRLYSVIDNKYVLFSVDEAFHLYGVDANQTILLPIPRFSLVAWQ